MFQTLFQLLSGSRRDSTRRRPRRPAMARRRPMCRLAVESLEDRLALSPMGCHGRDVQFDLQGNTFNITALADRVVIKCDSFDLGGNERVNFNLPTSTSAILTRVRDVDGLQPPSQIFGQIISNGQVFLSNPAGILFGTGSQVIGGSFFATTMKISTDNFKAGGDLTFRRDANVSPGAIVNQGDITVQLQGYLVLAGAAIDNEGRLETLQGSLYLAVGDQVTAHMMDDHILTNLSVDRQLSHGVAGEDVAILNTLYILASSSLIHIEAELTSGLYQHAIDNTGLIDASGVGTPDGEIDIVAHSDAHDADFHQGGTLNAEADGILYIDVDGMY